MTYSPIKKIPFGPYICDVDLEHQILELTPLAQNFKIKISYNNLNLISPEHILVSWGSSKRYKFNLCLVVWESIGRERVGYIPVY